jgi:hypothetical protein
MAVSGCSNHLTRIGTAYRFTPTSPRLLSALQRYEAVANHHRSRRRANIHLRREAQPSIMKRPITQKGLSHTAIVVKPSTKQWQHHIHFHVARYPGAFYEAVANHTDHAY